MHIHPVQKALFKIPALASSVSPSSQHLWWFRSLLSRSLSLFSPSHAMDLKQFVSRFESHFPPQLAEKWDNVGLLVEPTGYKPVSRVMLTNDLTEDVLEECVEKKADLIVSYHPPIFRPLKRLTQGNWKERVALTCIENRIAVYSPHTIFDSLAGGVTDWMLQPFRPGVIRVLDPKKRTAFAEGFDHRVAIASTSYNNDLVEFKSVEGVKVFQSPGGQAEILVQEGHLDRVVAALKAKGIPDGNICVFRLEPREVLPEQGSGREIKMEKELPLSEVVERTKDHLGVQNLRIALGRGANMESPVATIASCAGSGSSVLSGTRSNVWLTGEMSHHEVLDAVHAGTTCILAEHSNSERGFLRVLERMIREKVLVEGDDGAAGVAVMISERDRDPLVVV